jgi:hypothetical protein
LGVGIVVVQWDVSDGLGHGISVWGAHRYLVVGVYKILEGFL